MCVCMWFYSTRNGPGLGRLGLIICVCSVHSNFHFVQLTRQRNIECEKPRLRAHLRAEILTRICVLPYFGALRKAFVSLISRL